MRVFATKPLYVCDPCTGEADSSKLHGHDHNQRDHDQHGHDPDQHDLHEHGHDQTHPSTVSQH